MVGMMLWEPSGHWTRPVTLKEVSVLHIRFLCARMAQDRRRNPLTERRRLRTAGKKAAAAEGGAGGAACRGLSGGSAGGAAPGRDPAAPTGHRRGLVRRLLRFRGENPAGARVLITADALSGEVVRTVTELALRHRYLILKVPFGGEELCRRLRREYGVSIVLNPETEREPASVHMAFDPTEAQGSGFLPLYDESLPLPRLLLPPEVEARLPEGLDRGQLLSVLWRTGALRPGQVSVQLGETENKGAVPEIRAFCP